MNEGTTINDQEKENFVGPSPGKVAKDDWFMKTISVIVVGSINPF